MPRSTIVQQRARPRAMSRRRRACVRCDRLTAAARGRRDLRPTSAACRRVLVVTQLMASITDRTGDPLLLVKGGASLGFVWYSAVAPFKKDLDTVIRGDMESVHDRLGKR